MGAAKKSRAGKGAKSASSARKKTSVRKAAKKTTAKKRAAKKTTAKKGAAKKKPTAKKGAAKNGAAKKKTTAKKTGRKPSATKTSRKTSAKKAAAKKTARKKTARKKTTRATAGRAASTAPPKRRIRPAKLDRKTLTGIKEKLEIEKLELEAQLEEIQRDSVSESEDTGLHDDFADAGTSTFERERDLSIRNNVLDLLDQVTRALVRIDEGGYGTCENCGRPIDAARIRAFPRVLLCLDCKRRDERTR